jgi:predicted transcriptional regulator
LTNIRERITLSYRRFLMSQSMTVRIPDELSRQLQKISRDEGKPVSDLVRESLQKYIALYRYNQLRNRVIPYAEAQDIITDEDVFKRIS